VKPSPKGYNQYLRFSAVALQMGAVIGLFTWAGVEIDHQTPDEFPLWTTILSLVGVAAAIYLVIREVMRMSKND
jgi:F0F1-type ATP synthase assembly protein I